MDYIALKSSTRSHSVIATSSKTTKKGKKKVSFSPLPGECRASTVDSGTATPTSRIPRTKLSMKTRVTPKPKRVITSPTPSAASISRSNKCNDSGQQQKRRRRPKKPSLAVFSNSAQRKFARPRNILTAHLNFTLGILPKKVSSLRDDIDRCHADRIFHLEQLEQKFLGRMNLVRNLDLSQENNILLDRQFEVTDEMEQKLMELQVLIERYKTKLEIDRPRLRANFNQRYVCCKVCAATGKNNE